MNSRDQCDLESGKKKSIMLFFFLVSEKLTRSRTKHSTSEGTSKYCIKTSLHKIEHATLKC